MFNEEENLTAVETVKIEKRRVLRYNGQEDHSIALDDAGQFTAKYRQANPGKPKAGYFGREAIEKILSQKGVVGIRYYYAIDDDNKNVMVIVGVDAKGNDMEYGVLIERSYPCPPFCSDENRLNSDK